MHKTLLTAAILLSMLAFPCSSAAQTKSTQTPSSPTVVARGHLQNQTAPIPVTTIYTPGKDGLYRLSVYGTITTADPNSQLQWEVDLFSTDDSGPQTTRMAFGNGNTLGQFFTGFANSVPPYVVEAKAGSAISFSVIQFFGPDNSAYSLYYTLERLN